MKYIALILLAVLMLFDLLACIKILRSSLCKFSKTVIVSIRVLSYIFILVIPLFMFKSNNNGGEITKIIMSVITLFIFLAVAKLSFYIYWLPSKSKKLLYAGIISSVLVSSYYLYGVFVTRTNYKINEVSVSFKNLPESFDGYRIAFISDIHIGTMWNAQKELSELSGLISSTNADILMFGGDLVNMGYQEITPDILHELSELKCKEPTIAVLGNHDTGIYMFDSVNCPIDVNVANIKNRVESVGWQLLMDSTVYLYKEKDSIAVTGIDYNNRLLEYKHSFDNIDDYNPYHIYNTIDKDVFNITISHLPQLWNGLSSRGYSDLTLSGHIHSMQFKFNIFDWNFSPAKFMYKEWSGLYENVNGKLYINDGIGNVGFFARIGARPEITLITLKKGE